MEKYIWWIALGAFAAGIFASYIIEYAKSFLPNDLRSRLKNVKVMLKLAWVALRTDGSSFPVTVTTIMREESDALLIRRLEVPNEQASTHEEQSPQPTTH